VGLEHPHIGEPDLSGQQIGFGGPCQPQGFVDPIQYLLGLCGDITDRVRGYSWRVIVIGSVLARAQPSYAIVVGIAD
jgi:hypothetical protein